MHSLPKAVSEPALRLGLARLDDLKPFANNARTHSRRQVDQIAASISSFGFTNPILVDPDLSVIAGHGRILAARKLGLESVPILEVRDLTPAQVRALRIADNKIALNSGWDTDLLKIELAAISAEIQIQDLGFSPGEIDVILGSEVDVEDEVIPELPEAAITRLGDIWVLGEHRIGCGDCRDPGFLAEVIGEAGQVDAAFLDPPYNVRIQGHANVTSQHREFAMASGEMSASEFRAFLKASLGACARVSRPGAVHFVCMDWRHLQDLQWAGDEVYGDLLNLCVWNKSNAGMGSLYRSRHELVLVYRVGEAPHLNTVELGRHGRNRTNVWDYASVNTFQGARRGDLALHPTVKPVQMVADALQDVTRRGDLVLDAFLGSGASLLAAERTGRRFRGCDIDPLYVDLVVERWRRMTGGRPRLRRKG
jgi:DNA modification methylase